MNYVAVDAMSGDLGPESAVEGSIQAVKEWNIPVILVGNEKILNDVLKKYSYDKDMVIIYHTDEVIRMDESPSRAVKEKKNASVVIAANLVKKGEAIGFFSPGNTGATMASALFYLGRVDGVYRPCIASPIPRADGGTTLLIDSGANVDSKSEWLVQFALMGELYVKEMFGVTDPKIAILSNGEENKKGNVVSVQAFEKLQKLPIHFIGNIEGRDLYGGTPRYADVVVCDGFVGNVVLKATEGLASVLFKILKEKILNSNLAKTGAFLLKPVLTEIKKRMDYSEYGGAPLLGVKGACLIGHGSSSARAFKNAIRVCYEYSQKGIDYKLNRLFARKFSFFG